MEKRTRDENVSFVQVIKTEMYAKKKAIAILVAFAVLISAVAGQFNTKLSDSFDSSAYLLGLSPDETAFADSLTDIVDNANLIVATDTDVATVVSNIEAAVNDAVTAAGSSTDVNVKVATVTDAGTITDVDGFFVTVTLSGVVLGEGLGTSFGNGVRVVVTLKYDDNAGGCFTPFGNSEVDSFSDVVDDIFATVIGALSTVASTSDLEQFVKDVIIMLGEKDNIDVSIAFNTVDDDMLVSTTFSAKDGGDFDGSTAITSNGQFGYCTVKNEWFVVALGHDHTGTPTDYQAIFDAKVIELLDLVDLDVFAGTPTNAGSLTDYFNGIVATAGSASDIQVEVSFTETVGDDDIYWVVVRGIGTFNGVNPLGFDIAIPNGNVDPGTDTDFQAIFDAKVNAIYDAAKVNVGTTTDITALTALFTNAVATAGSASDIDVNVAGNGSSTDSATGNVTYKFKVTFSGATGTDFGTVTDMVKDLEVVIEFEEGSFTDLPASQTDIDPELGDVKVQTNIEVGTTLIGEDGNPITVTDTGDLRVIVTQISDVVDNVEDLYNNIMNFFKK